MQLKLASYNIRKAVGGDGERNPDRILAVLREIDADVVALQEVDRRFGRRASVLPLAAIHDHTPYRPAPLRMLPESLGWHGNALLVRRGIEITAAEAVPLPTLEPRGAVCAELSIEGRAIHVVAMHLDLSGLRRRHQLEAVLAHLGGKIPATPAVMMGDLNEWSRHGGALRAFGAGWQVLMPGRSFPARRPIACLDRIIASRDWQVRETGVHHSALAAKGSDHLPVYARLELGGPVAV
jgi:endonuclease/exonuclease/phosphatase family metal-dependent hydrolase